MMLFYVLLGLAQAAEHVMDKAKANVELDSQKGEAVSMHDEGTDESGDLAERIDRMFARMDVMQDSLSALVTASEKRGPYRTYPEIIPGADIQPAANMDPYTYSQGPCLDQYPGSVYNTTHPCVRDDCAPACGVMAKATCQCEINGIMRTLSTREGSPGNPASCGFVQMDFDRHFVPTLCLAWVGSSGFMQHTNAGQAVPLCSTCKAWGAHRETPSAADWARDDSPHVGTWGPRGIGGPRYYSAADGRSGSFSPPTPAPAQGAFR